MNKDMVVTATPLRVSFLGGGTDFPDFFSRKDGVVVSSTINKNLYVTVKRHGKVHKENYRINYSSSEIVDDIDEIKNRIARECIRITNTTPPLYISTIADIPESSGLGSSSAFAVGLLKALHTLAGRKIKKEELAEQAARVELDILNRPMGLQDHYSAAFGGLNLIKFSEDREVQVEKSGKSISEIRYLFDNLMMFWTGIQRDSSTILDEQNNKINEKIESLITLRNKALKFWDLLHNDFSIENLGKEIGKGWEIKSRLASKITNYQIDEWYEKAIISGAVGGKLCGAGGGGFFLLVVHPESRTKVRKALSELTEVKIGYSNSGSKVILSI